jgi:hypothetical protein
MQPYEELRTIFNSILFFDFVYAINVKNKR